jgi:hypothetical protein
VASLLAGGPSPAKAAYLGIVIHAESAYLGEAAASVGSTIFGGEKLSTDAGGLLRIAIPAVTLQLGEQSSLVLGHAADPQQSILAELACGTLIFSAAATGSIAIAADDALVRSADNTATAAHIRMVNQKELRIYAQRGALEFSYHGESATIPEGRNYRVILDPSEREVAASESDQTPHRPWNHHRTFILVAIAVGVAVGIAIPIIIHAVESPDSPGSSPPVQPKKP